MSTAMIPLRSTLPVCIGRMVKSASVSSSRGGDASAAGVALVAAVAAKVVVAATPAHRGEGERVGVTSFEGHTVARVRRSTGTSTLAN